jgi:predicted permease
MAFWRRFRQLFHRVDLDREIDEELQSHIAMRTADNIADGMTPEAARREALLKFGNPSAMKEKVAGIDAALGFDNFLRDIRYALRQLRKSPGFALTAIVTLALGIGATTGIFSVMNAVLLRPLPLPNPQQLFYFRVPGGQPHGAINTGYTSETSFSEPVFESLRKNRRIFSAVMAFAPISGFDDKATVRIDNSAEQANGDVVSGNFFSGLGVAIARGRGFTLTDEKQHSSVVILSYNYWTRRFLRSPSVLGQTIFIKGISFTIIGIANKNFRGLEPGQFTDFWIPLQVRPEFDPWGTSPGDFTLYGSPKWWSLNLIARLAPGMTPQKVLAETNPQFQNVAYDGLGTPDPKYPKVKLALIPANGIYSLSDNYREPITILMGLVSLVLLIACNNVAMLIVARNTSRLREFSLRIALGAQRSTLLRQLLTESIFLVTLGAVFGWFLALAAIRSLTAWSLLQVNLAPDHRVLLFTGVVSVLATLIFGLAPLHIATNAPVTAALRSSASVSYQSRRGKFGGKSILALQVALCFTLLMAAGLLLCTLLNYENTNLGMRTQGVLVFGITPQQMPNNDATNVFYSNLLAGLRILPGVESATFMDTRPGSGWSSKTDAIVDGVKYPSEKVQLRVNNVGPDFLHVLGIPLLLGRDIIDADTSTSPRVVVVNEAFVNKLFPHSSPIGHRLGNPKRSYTIVGVSKDSKDISVDEGTVPMAYFPYTQAEGAPSTLQVEIRTTGSPLALLPTIAKAVHEIDGNLPLENSMTQAQVFRDSYAQQSLFSKLALFFGLLAALLVGIGLYGSLSYRVGSRTTEIGVRLALGAQRSQVLHLVVLESMRVVAAGVAIGIPMTFFTGHLMESMLFGLAPYDVLSLVAALTSVICIGLMASWVPARRAASIDPMQALRSE